HLADGGGECAHEGGDGTAAGNWLLCRGGVEEVADGSGVGVHEWFVVCCLWLVVRFHSRQHATDNKHSFRIVLHAARRQVNRGKLLVGSRSGLHFHQFRRRCGH